MNNIDDKTKKLALKSLILLLFIAVVLKIPSVYEDWKYGRQAVRSLECEFVGTIRPTEQISRSMIRVTAQTPNGERYDVTDKYTVDVVQAPLHGSSFDIIVSYRGINQPLTIPITRTPVVEYSIGYPDYDDVKATLYNNGDLIFTGEGRTREFSKNKAPWKGNSYSYIEFAPGIEVRNMDYWFMGNENLTECKNIPKTVESMISTFEGDTAMTSTPEYFQCTNLRLMVSTFKGCSSMKKADTLPVEVINANNAFADCVSLEKAPDIMKAGKLSSANGMFAGCTKLIEAPQLPNSITNMKNCYAGCINIHKAAPFPVKVENIAGCYSGCKSLEEATSIPESVINYESCFKGCRDLSGRLEINTDSGNYSSLLADAVWSGKVLYLSGNCGYLIDIQHAANNSFVVLEDLEEATRQSKRLKTELGG